MLKLLIFLIAGVVVLRFILRFVLPLLNITYMAQDRLRDMQRQMDEMNRQARQTESQHSIKSKPKPKKEEYIDYEEVRN